MTLRSIDITTGDAPRLTLIWLHGLGADGRDFEPIAEQLALPFAARFVFPDAPVRPITINGGLPMRAWFDILTHSRSGPEDEAAIRHSAGLVAELIDLEMGRGTPAAQIVVAGFSQGGALALHLGLRESRRLAGIVALSAFLPLAATLVEQKASANADTPIFMAHGTADPIIELEFAESALRTLRYCGYDPQWRTYPIGHGVCTDEIRDIAEWLGDLVNRAGRS